MRTVSPTPVTGAATFTDPLAGLAVPSATGMTNYGAVNLSGNSLQTINPGIYTSITVSGNGKLTMNPGIYAIAGGGFNVSGNGSVSVGTVTSNVTGTGVMIYNAGSNFLTTGGTTFGTVTLSGNGTISLTPATTGTYAGILIFQSRDNTKVLTFSGNGIVMPGGLIYAPKAALAISGNGQFKGSIIVDTINISGNTILNQQLASDGATVYTPAQVRGAYGVNNLTLDGTGQTIAIVDAYDDPDIYQAPRHLRCPVRRTSAGPNLFDQYGPASGFLSVLNQQGQSSNLPNVDPTGAGVSNWEMEETLDVEWVHAIAPGAQIILVEANSQSLPDLMTGVQTAAQQPGVSVVSMSWGFAENQVVMAADEAHYDSYLTTPAGHQGVTFVASTGDYGTADPEYPAFSPNVLAVGGTSLNLNSDDSYHSETAWGTAGAGANGQFIGSGGGLSQFEAEPAWQLAVQNTGARSTPDVAMIADPATGAWIADPYNLPSDNPWAIVGGTSLSAPSWAGLIVLANQGRADAGQPTLNSTSPTETQSAVYNLPIDDFNTIGSANTGAIGANAGYNLMTGLGSPVANLLVPDLVNYVDNGPAVSQRTLSVTADSAAAMMSNAGDSSTPMNVINAMNAISVFNAEFVAAPGLGLGWNLSPNNGAGSGETAHKVPVQAAPAATASASFAVGRACCRGYCAGPGAGNPGAVGESGPDGRVCQPACRRRRARSRRRPCPA